MMDRSKRDAPMFFGGGYVDRDGLWRTDHRTVGEYRRDSAVLLLSVFAAPFLILGVALVVLRVLQVI